MRKLKLEELERVSIDEYKSAAKIPVVAVLDNIRSAMNVGSVFRTADAFAIEKIIICGISATPPNREITKTAIGATESVVWEYIENVSDAVAQLKNEGYIIAGIEQTDASVLLTDYTLNTEKIAVVFGNEVDGVSDEIINELDVCIEIPQFGTKHSLNVSVCAGIVLWELAKKYHLT
ncbi:MAG TPA: RNA methyltransferase [Saprospiraceae bacterium]|nr:RNA methyltransferase [Saprospiraceae bacterium]HMU03106.1 RNA methyltransferase [Saprospiraceae bacterium]